MQLIINVEEQYGGGVELSVTLEDSQIYADGSNVSQALRNLFDRLEALDDDELETVVLREDK